MKYTPSFKNGCDFGAISPFRPTTPKFLLISPSIEFQASEVTQFQKSKNCVFRVDVVKRTLQKEVLSEISANIAKFVVTNSYFGDFRIIVRVQAVITELYCDFPQCLQAISVVQF
jgi:hypothetical protein